MDSDVGFLVTWARDKEMYYRSEFNRGGEFIKLILNWFSGGMFFLLGFLVASPSLDEGTKAILGVVGVFGVGLYISWVYEFGRRALAAVENWTAVRLSVLQELPFFVSMQPDIVLNLLMQIDQDAATWFSLDVRERYRRVVRRARKERLVPHLTYITKTPEDAVRFVKGEISGPWDFVPGVPR